MKKTINIAIAVESEFNRKITFLKKRAKKINVPFSVTAADQTSFVDHPDHKSRKVECREYTVESGDLVVSGYSLVASLDRTVVEGENIVRTVPGETCPEHYQQHDGNCDHCNTKRIRKLVAVLRNNETGEHVAIGRSCVRDYIGYDVEALCDYMSKIFEVFAYECFGEKMCDMRMDDLAYDSSTILAQAAAIVRIHGWVPMSAFDPDNMDNDVYPTKHRVTYVLNKPFTDRDIATWIEYKKKVKPTDADIKEASLAREWIAAHTGNNDYIHNLRLLNKAGGVSHKTLGMWISLVAAYQRDMDKLVKAQKEQESMLNEHYGDVKTRYELALTVKRKTSRMGTYGETVIMGLVDNDGRQYTWFGTSDLAFEMEKGNTYNVKATVKKHDEFNGMAQTVITRVQEIAA